MASFDWQLLWINLGITALATIAGAALLLLYFVSIALGGQ